MRGQWGASAPWAALGERGEQWRDVVYKSKGMREFRTVMFSRLVPNLREIGLLSPRIMPRYEEVGLMQYFGGLAADKLTADALVSGLAA